ncbi:MAG: tetratricopeptide repeat protein [Alphaproteobacteria bacterium]|nr:tetratricopeptide repeat protein [Alphaproteobacteria bacterium]
MDPKLLEDLQRAAGLYQAGDYAGALAISEAALARFPGDPEALHLKALSLAGLGRAREAEAAYRETLRRHSNKAAVLNNLANLLAAQDRLEDAAAAYREALALEPRFANAWANLGSTLDKAGDFAGAEDALRAALSLDPSHIGALINLGAFLNRRGRYEEALAPLDAALRIQPGRLEALVNRGVAYRETGRLAEARRDHESAAAVAPKRVEAIYQLANTLRALGDIAAAGAAYRRAMALAPFRVDLHNDYAQMMWESGEKESYLGEIDKSLALKPDVDLLLARADLAFRGGEVAQARRSAQQAQALSPKNARALGLLARIARTEGRLDDARRFAEAGCAADPADFAVLHECAEILLVVGAYEQAAALLARDAPAEHLQKHIALRALAMRASGDAGYKVFYDYDRFTAKLFIETPPGYASLAAFNEALEAAIRPLHVAKTRPIGQTLYGGTQSFGRLWNEPHPAIQALKTALLDAASRYVAGLPDDPDHPFLAQKTQRLACAGAWSVMLSSGGGHVDHIHPKGWISASYYVRVPPEVGADSRSGCLRLGASGVAGLDLPGERFVKPEAGAVIFFPSYVWHGVEPFTAETPRITAPFDLAPC